MLFAPDLVDVEEVLTFAVSLCQDEDGPASQKLITTSPVVIKAMVACILQQLHLNTERVLSCKLQVPISMPRLRSHQQIGVEMFI